MISEEKKGKDSASTPSLPDPAFSHMNQYSSEAGLSEPGARESTLTLSKHLQLTGCSTNFPSTRIFTKKGVLIVFEGTDGTGKTTQVQLLASALQEQGLPVVSTREPTEGRYGQEIRALYSNRAKVSLEEELDLFIADRKEHIDTLLAPALASGKIILCDRYYLSTIAYQGAAGLDPAQILARNAFAPTPDLALLFHASVQTGVKRITENRGEALNDFEKEEYLQKVAAQFEQMDFPWIKRVDAARSIDVVHQEILHLVQPLLETQ